MFKALTSPKRAGIIISMSLLLAYGVTPLGMYYLMDNDYAIILAKVTLVGFVSFLLGWWLPVRGRMYLLSVDLETLIQAIWIPFILFTLLAWVSAERIPLVAALQGLPSEQVNEYREKFLKGREGWQQSFAYINTYLTGALIPYSTALLFYFKIKFRWWYFLFFLLFCVSFVEKAFFFRAFIPLFFLVAQKRLRMPLRPAHFIALGFGLLVLVSLAAGFKGTGAPSDADFMSANYSTSGTLDSLLWRALAIPIITSVDSIRVFYQDYGGRFFHGATSTLFAGLFGLPHVQFEREVFAGQWGQNTTATGSANAVFLIEAFTNWGYLGVVFISGIIGMIFKFICDSRDYCLQGTWMLLFFTLYNAGFIGTMVSNGYLALFFIIIFVRVKIPKPTIRSKAVG
jgi:hypothetical protein